MRNGILAVLFALLSPAAFANDAVHVATDGVQFVATWRDQKTDQLLVQRIAARGAAIDAAQVVGNAPSDSAICFGSSSYLIVWSSGGSLLARRMTASGVLIDAQPRLLAQTATPHPAIAWNGSAWLVVWTTGDDVSGSAWSIMLTPDGIATAPESIAGDPDYKFSAPRVAWNGSDFIFAWLRTWRHCALPCQPIGITWERLTASGLTVTDSSRTLSASPISAFAMVVDGDTPVFAFDMPAGVWIQRGAYSQFSQPQKVFSWFATTASDLVSTGDGFLIATRYGTDIPGVATTPDPRHWLTLIRVTRDLANVSRVVMRLENDVVADRPGVVMDSSGTPLVVVPSTSGPRLHSEKEMHVPSAPPQKPLLLSAANYGPTTHLTWNSDGANVDGFIAYRWSYFYTVFMDAVALTGANARGADVQASFAGTIKLPAGALVVAFNEGGSSQWSNMLFPKAASRNRAVRH